MFYGCRSRATNTGMRQQSNEQARYREALRRKGWTLAHAAAETGYSYSYLAMMIREPRLMPDEMRELLDGVLGLERTTEPRE